MKEEAKKMVATFVCKNQQIRCKLGWETWLCFESNYGQNKM